MTTHQIRLPVKPHARQLDLIHSQARYNVIAAGRRWGKTEACKIRAIYRAPRQRVWWVMPTRQSGQAVWRDFEVIFRNTGAYINRSERLIQFDKTRFLQVVAADSQLRSAGLDHVIVDEAAFINPDLWPFVLRPMLLEARGSADFASSTNGRNWFWQIYQLGLDPQQPDWRSWHFTCYDAPHIEASEIEDIRRHTPERVFSQEYLAEFLDDGGAVFRNLQACIAAPPKNASGGVVIGVDWARHNDYTVLTVMDRAGRVLAIDRFNEINWTTQRNRLTVLAQRYQAEMILAETNSIGEPNIEELQKAGLPVRGFTTTAASKQQVINALALAFEQQSICIPNDPVLLAELQAYTLEKLPSGNYRYTAPAGMHDDTVISLALAWHARNEGSAVTFLRF